jgi:hypothetical protein
MRSSRTFGSVGAPGRATARGHPVDFYDLNPIVGSWYLELPVPETVRIRRVLLLLFEEA